MSNVSFGYQMQIGEPTNCCSLVDQWATTSGYGFFLISKKEVPKKWPEETKEELTHSQNASQKQNQNAPQKQTRHLPTQKKHQESWDHP